MSANFTAQILLVDDDAGSREALSLLLRNASYGVDVADSGEAALELLGKSSYDVVLTDLFLPGVSGIDILKQVKEDAPATNVILITGHASAESAVEAMKEGAFDYITKPVDFSKLKLLMVKAVEKSRLVAENLYLRQQLRGKYKFDNIIGNSAAMQRVFSRLEKILHTDSTIMILGESGTGKELVARAIHFNGSRKDKPFVAINCGAIPAELLESELFGHMRGSFTGAVVDKPGKFEAANGGTIFLDEIGTMPLPLQMKLLRVLQDHEIERVGSSRKTKLDVRVISATNADLEEEVNANRFREDLYYRLNVIPVVLPPLRERREDVALLARHFLQKLQVEMNRPGIILEADALAVLESYDWPGNVREMENILERTVALTETDRITAADLPPAMLPKGGSENQAAAWPRLAEDGVDLPQLVADLERDMISQALARGRGVKARAAALLGLNRTTLVEKIRRLGLNAGGKVEQ